MDQLKDRNNISNTKEFNYPNKIGMVMTFQSYHINGLSTFV